MNIGQFLQNIAVRLHQEYLLLDEHLYLFLNTGICSAIIDDFIPVNGMPIVLRIAITLQEFAMNTLHAVRTKKTIVLAY